MQMHERGGSGRWSHTLVQGSNGPWGGEKESKGGRRNRTIGAKAEDETNCCNRIISDCSTAWFESQNALQPCLFR